MSEERNFICDQSGFKLDVSQSAKQWDGARVGYRFVDRRNPQDFLRGVKDTQRVPWSRPEAPDVFIEPTSVRPEDL